MTKSGTVDQQRASYVVECMGTVFSFDIRDPGTWGDALGAAVASLHRVDKVFSTYRADSDISRIRRGELTIEDADPDVAEILDSCAMIEAQTGGYFSAFWDNEVDPTGLVKGWAIEEASRILIAHGSVNHTVNGGGDVQLAGEAAPGQAWRVGISDPLDRTRILTVVSRRDFAVATSGIAERGAHIVNPLTGLPARELASVTVVGRSLALCDAYATAAFAMGPHGLGWVEDLPEHEALFVSADGLITGTVGLADAV